MRYRFALAVLAMVLGSLVLTGCRNGPFARPAYYCQPAPCQPVICCPQ